MKRYLAIAGVILFIIIAIWFFTRQPQIKAGAVSFKGARYEGPHEGYIIDLDWENLPRVDYQLTVPTAGKLQHYQLLIDGQSVAAGSNSGSNMVQGNMQLVNTPGSAKLVITDSIGSIMEWTYDFNSKTGTFPPVR